jgi:adrenodoxin-NADP+ reductase
VSLIGNGNVSLDIARMLLSSPSDLAKYDIPEHVLDVLSRSSVKHVSIIARRGPFEAAFTVKELRELMNLPEASMVPIDPSVLTPSPDVKLTRQQTRALQLMRKGSDKSLGTTPKTWSLDFFRSPTGLAPPSSSSPLAQLALAHTSLDPKTNRAVSTGETSVLPTSLVVTSLGFHSDPMMSFYDPGLGHLRTLSGRVISSSGTALRNVYASGWAATGAKGVLASTMMDAYAVADTIVSDLHPKGEEADATSVPPSPSSEQINNDILMNSDPHLDGVPPEIEVTLKEGLVTGYEDWKAIDTEEVRRGEAIGKERERMGWEEARIFLVQSRTATS